MAQESKLLITVDSRKAKTELDSVDKSLKSVEMQGDKTAKKSKDLGGAFKQAGDAAKSAKDGVSSFDGSLGGLTKTLGSSSALLSGAAIGIASIAGAAVGSLGALTGMALAYSNNAKEIQNLATVADMGVVEFQRMAVAADQVGITTEQLSDQIKDFNEKLGEFVLTGKGEATDAFELLQKHSKMSGEEIKKFALEMQKASGGDAMQMYVNKLEEAGVSQEQMSFLTENMANDFTKLLPILADNGAMIKQWGDAGEEAGAVMQETAIQQALLFGSQVKDLELKLKGMQNTVMVAVVPALIDVADAFFNGADNGNTMQSISETLGNTLRVLGGVAIVVGRSFNALGMAIGAAAAAQVAFMSGDFKGALNIAGQGIKDQIDNIEAGYKQIKAIASTDASSKVKPLERPKNNGSGKGGIGITTGLDDFAAGEKEKTKKAKSEGDKRKREAERLAKEIARIEYEYATADQQRRMKLNDEIEHLQEKGMSKYIDDAQDRYNQEEKLIQMKFEFELAEHLMTEEQKLRFSMNIREQEIKADHDLTKEQKALKKSSLDEQFKQEQALLMLAQETQLFQIKQAYMHEVDLMQERYRLEMQEIDKIADAKQRAAMREATAARLIDDYEKKRKNAEDNFNQVAAKIGGFEEYYAIQKEMEDAAAVMEEARKYELISEEEHKAALIEIEKRYMDAKMSLNLSYGQQIAGSVADMFKQEGDKQNKYYKAAITAEKAFSIARAMIAIKTGIALAANNPWPLNLAAMASVAAQTASIVSDIRTIHVEGLATGGKIRGAGTPTSDSIPILASDREYMVRAYAAEKLGTPTMDYINKYGELPQNTHRVGMGAVNAIGSGRGGDVVVQPKVSVVVENYTSGQVQTKVDEDGRIRVIIRDEVDKYLPGQMNNSNSKIHKAVVRNTTATTKR